ncbi:MAG: type 4a pilus biogenesis protein PilO [Elusimicrobia bacterium]|nr:type 4a pilus biogenesis protein PilO [Elusimicrobiota bacterium]
MGEQKTPVQEKIKSYFKDMLADILIIYGEKGFAPFKRPLTIAGPSLLLLYAAVYSPITSKLAKTQRSIISMEAVAQYADEYESAKMRLTGLQRRLPRIADKGEWLNYLLTETSRNAGVSIESRSAQNETEVSGYLVVSREVSTTTTYALLGKWLADIENSPIFVRITDLQMSRQDSSPGMVKASFTISTVFPRLGGGGGS